MNTPMHRFKYTKLTKEQIAKKLVSAKAGPKCLSEFSDVLVGKSLKIVTDDGPVLSIDSGRKIDFRSPKTAELPSKQVMAH